MDTHSKPQAIYPAVASPLRTGLNANTPSPWNLFEPRVGGISNHYSFGKGRDDVDDHSSYQSDSVSDNSTSTSQCSSRENVYPEHEAATAAALGRTRGIDKTSVHLDYEFAHLLQTDLLGAVIGMASDVPTHVCGTDQAAEFLDLVWSGVPLPIGVSNEIAKMMTSDVVSSASEAEANSNSSRNSTNFALDDLAMDCSQFNVPTAEVASVSPSLLSDKKRERIEDWADQIPHDDMILVTVGPSLT